MGPIPYLEIFWVGPLKKTPCSRVADVGGARERRSMTGQGLLRQEGPPTYGIFLKRGLFKDITNVIPICQIGKYRVFFSKGPTQKISKYGIGPTQQDKMAKYTGPTQSYQRSKE